MIAVVTRMQSHAGSKTHLYQFTPRISSFRVSQPLLHGYQNTRIILRNKKSINTSRALMTCHSAKSDGGGARAHELRELEQTLPDSQEDNLKVGEFMSKVEINF